LTKRIQRDLTLFKVLIPIEATVSDELDRELLYVGLHALNPGSCWWVPNALRNSGHDDLLKEGWWARLG
jgi:hypothetical protein